MKDKNGKTVKVGDIVQHPSYYPTGIVVNDDGDVRIPCHGYEFRSVHKCKLINP